MLWLCQHPCHTESKSAVITAVLRETSSAHWQSNLIIEYQSTVGSLLEFSAFNTEQTV